MPSLAPTQPTRKRHYSEREIARRNAKKKPRKNTIAPYTSTLCTPPYTPHSLALTATHHINHNPHLHLPKPQGGQISISLTTALTFNDYAVTQLPTAPSSGRFEVPTPRDHPLYGQIPEYLALRFDNLFSPGSRYELNEAAQNFFESRPVTPSLKKANDDQRSANHTFYHFGHWGKSNPSIMLTSDTRNIEPPAARVALHELLSVLQTHFIPVLLRVMRPSLPTHFQTTDRYVPLPHHSPSTL